MFAGHLVNKKQQNNLEDRLSSFMIHTMTKEPLIFAGLCEQLDVVLILDYSGSISFEAYGWEHTIEFAQKFIQAFRDAPDTAISIIRFNLKASQVVRFASVIN